MRALCQVALLGTRVLCLVALFGPKAPNVSNWSDDLRILTLTRDCPDLYSEWMVDHDEECFRSCKYGAYNGWHGPANALTGAAHLAARAGHLDIVKFCLERNCVDCDCMSNPDEWGHSVRWPHLGSGLHLIPGTGVCSGPRVPIQCIVDYDFSVF